MSLVIVLSDNAVANMRATGRFPAEMLGSEVFIHDTHEVYIESGRDNYTNMSISESDRLDQAYYTAMAQNEAQRLSTSHSRPTPIESPRNLKIYWK